MAKSTSKTGKTPNGNNWALVEAVAIKIGGIVNVSNSDVLLSADVYVSRAKKAGKSDDEIAKMSVSQFKKL